MILQLTRLPSDADPQSRKLDRAELLNDRLQPVVTASRSARAQSQSSQRQIRIVDDDEQIGGREFVKACNLAHRPSAQIHEGRRLGEQHAIADLGNLRCLRFPLRVIFQRHAIATRKLFGDLEPDIVPGVLVLAARIAETNDQLQGRRYFFSFFAAAGGASAPSSSFLPFLMTSGSAATAAVPATAPSAGAGASSTFGMMTCSNIISG